jgi:hypothetical protein
VNDPQPICRRGAFIKHLSLISKCKWEDDTNTDPIDAGIPGDGVCEVFDDLSSILPNLRSVRLDGWFYQQGWDTLLMLPSSQELRLRRTVLISEVDIQFKGFSKLRAFEFEIHSLKEALALGAAVRECPRETSHRCGRKPLRERRVIYFFLRV